METKATFWLPGNTGLTAGAVTRRLGLEPTRAHEAGDAVSPHPPVLAVLLSSSPEISPGTEVAGHLHRLLAILEPAAGQLGELG